MLKIIGRFILFVVLTVFTQIGGLVYIFSIYFSRKLKFIFKGKLALVFILFYVLITFLLVPILAPMFGRVKIANTEFLKPASFSTIILNRNYVAKDLNSFLQSVSKDFEEGNRDVGIRYLDACFPFVDGFPLLPHLSHNDGKKIDFSLVYEDEGGEIINESKSVSGYGVFEEPKPEEFNQCLACKEKGYFQYDYPKYLTLGRINSDLRFSEIGTKYLIESLLRQEKLSRLFIEPHLKKRMKLKDERIRFHGCKAVRHDDHIHIQIK